MPEHLPLLGELGAWEFASRIDNTPLASDDFLIESFRTNAIIAANGPHGYRPTVVDQRYVGREEVLFERVPGEKRYVKRDVRLDELMEVLASALHELEGEHRPSTAAKLPTGFYSPTDVAKHLNVPEKSDAIRKALGRLFEDNLLPDKSWLENNNPARGQAKILYSLELVRPFLGRFEKK